MDENEYKKTFQHVNQTPCAFSKAILRRCCGCRHAQKLLLAEREAVACLSPEDGYLRCTRLLPLFRNKAMFSLKLTHLQTGALPHGKEVKVQCGSMHGLSLALQQPLQQEKVTDIYATLNDAITAFGNEDSFPYSEITKAIVHFSVRGK